MVAILECSDAQAIQSWWVSSYFLLDCLVHLALLSSMQRRTGFHASN